MDKTYGIDFVDKLIQLRNEQKHFTSQELLEKIEEYKEKLENL